MTWTFAWERCPRFGDVVFMARNGPITITYRGTPEGIRERVTRPEVRSCWEAHDAIDALTAALAGGCDG